jgi:hypothetical protein
MRRIRGFRAVVGGVETAAAFPATSGGGGTAAHGGVGYRGPWKKGECALDQEKGGAFNG